MKKRLLAGFILMCVSCFLNAQLQTNFKFPTPPLVSGLDHHTDFVRSFEVRPVAALESGESSSKNVTETLPAQADAPPTPSPTPSAGPVRAVIGLGFHITGLHPDYSVSSNVINASHLGQVTPQYLLGVGYEIPVNYAKDQSIEGNKSPCKDKMSFRCRPYSAFVSAKFSPASTDTVNGVSFGVFHKVTSYFSVLVAASLDPSQQPSPGFVKAAVATVTAQQALGNPYYAQFDPKAMQDPKDKTAFDGFSTLFITSATDKNTGAVSFTQGSPISPGNPLITNYHFGWLFGVALTPDFKNLLGIK